MRYTHIDSYKYEEAHGIFQTYMYICIHRYGTYINTHMHTHSQTYTRTYFHTNAHTCRYRLLKSFRDMSSRSNLSCPDTKLSCPDTSNLSCPDTSYLNFSRLFKTFPDFSRHYIWCTRCNYLICCTTCRFAALEATITYHTVCNVTMLTFNHYLSMNVALHAPMHPFAIIRSGSHPPCSCISDARLYNI